MSEKHKVGTVSDFADNSMTSVEVAGQDILLVHQHGSFYALPNQCTHAKFPLDDGELLEGKVKCQYHGASFHLETGAASFPAIKKIKLYTAAVEDDAVYISLQEK